ncbi:MAG: RHS repeat domain-containing protein, partial [Actinomycetes bacterium]
MEALLDGYHAYAAKSSDYPVNAAGVLAGLVTYVDRNGQDDHWVQAVASAFRKADSSGRLATVPDGAIEAALEAADLASDRGPFTFDDPIALGKLATAGYTNDPVNTATGNFVEVEIDLPSRGLLRGLQFARTFNSRSDQVGPFGRGWASWATARLRAEPGGALWESPDGQRATIPASAEGYQRVAGIAGLVVPGPAGLALEWFGGARWEFDVDGLPLTVRDGPGTQVRFRHEDGRLVELRHQGGKRVELIWDGDRISELISELACSGRHRVTYRYDDAGNLVEVDGGPLGRRRYELDANGRVLAAIDADGVVEVRNT